MRSRSAKTQSSSSISHFYLNDIFVMHFLLNPNIPPFLLFLFYELSTCSVYRQLQEIFFRSFLGSEISEQNAQNAAAESHRRIGCGGPENWFSIWRALPATHAAVNCPPANSLHYSTIVFYARHIIWKRSMEEQRPVMVGSRLATLCSTITLSLLPRMRSNTQFSLIQDGCDTDGYHKSKAKRVRTTFTEEQLQVLQANFQIDSNPDGQDLERIASVTGLSKRVTQVWFQNSRARQKKHIHAGKNGWPRFNWCRRSNRFISILITCICSFHFHMFQT